MGVHWARDGTVAFRTHGLTQNRIVVGPGLAVTQEVRAPVQESQTTQVFMVMPSHA